MRPEISSLVLSVGTGVAAGLVGCFAVMRRMTLAADAISHIALPGIGLAILLHLNPILGGVTMLLLGTLLVWGLENRTRVPTETVIGVVFSAALAVGSLLTSGEELIEALFGQTGPPSALELVLAMLAAALVSLLVFRERHRLILFLVSPEIARTSGIRVEWLDLRFLLVFALTIALGLRYVGVLLIGALVIIPAATAKQLARSLRAMLGIAVGVSVFATTGGTYAAGLFHREAGPLVVLIAAACFLVSLLVRRTG
jgi:ABC-type Mn2+/Zn2+ transport system permease subunit